MTIKIEVDDEYTGIIMTSLGKQVRKKYAENQVFIGLKSSHDFCLFNTAEFLLCVAVRGGSLH